MPGFIGTQNAIPTDQVTVLQAVVALIQAAIPSLAEDNTCFFSLDPSATPEERQNLYAVVTPLNGQFDAELFAGSGIAGVCERSGVAVTLYSQMQLDRADADSAMLTDSARGLLVLKQQVLKTLSSANLLDNGGNKLLLNLMQPVSARQDHRNGVGSFTLNFSTDFVWNLS